MNIKKPLLLICIVSSLSACSTVTKEVINTPQSAPQISPTIEYSSEKSLKRKIAIARFSNETKHGSSFLLDENNDRVGKQAMDILSTRLASTGKFLMLERADLNKIQSERSLSNIDAKKVGADYLIIGSVSEFGRSTNSEVGIFSRNKIQTARAKVNVRLVDVKTGQIIFSQEGTGTAESEANAVFGVGNRAGYDATLDDKALSAAISKLTSNLIENLLDMPWQSYILDEQEGFYILAGGESQGLKNGDIFSVQKRGKSILNPQTGLTIELPGKEIAQIKVQQLVGSGENEISLCAVIDGTLASIPFDQLIVKEIN